MDFSTVKTVIVSLLTGLAAYLHPLTGDLYSLMSVFALNFLFGLLAGLLANGESFLFRKAWKCVSEAALFFVMVCAIYFIGEHKGNPDGALQCVSFVTYSVLYFYTVNILRNLKLLLNEDGVGYKVVAWLHWVVSVEFVKKIPRLSEYLNVREDGKEKKDRQDYRGGTVS